MDTTRQQFGTYFYNRLNTQPEKENLKTILAIIVIFIGKYCCKRYSLKVISSMVERLAYNEGAKGSNPLSLNKIDRNCCLF